MISNFNPQLMYYPQQPNQIHPIEFFYHYYHYFPCQMRLNNPEQIMNANFPTNIQIKQIGSSYLSEQVSPQKKSQQQENRQIQTKSNLEDSKINPGKFNKLNRNLNSIVLRNFANFINAHPQILNQISEIIQKNRLSLTPKEYKNLFFNCFTPGQSYVSMRKLKQFLRRRADVKLITLILLRKFISIDYFTVMIKSKKVMKSVKLKELKQGKKLWASLLEKMK